jgi:hypothetical protein
VVEVASDAALDVLYGVDPSDFVATRKQLAVDLRTSGDKDGAKAVLAARRPSTAAWALNQLARRAPDVVEMLLDSSRELFAAQTRARSGQADALRNAMRAHREALDRATDAALALLGDRANDGFKNEIVSTLRAASTDEDAAQLLQTGRVIREVSSSGFPDVAGLTLVPDLPAAKPRDEREQEREQERAREARRRADVAARDAALGRAARADADADRARARIEELTNALDAANDELRVASAEGRTAAAEAARLSQALD